jgi:hypothetical protein
VHPAEVAEHEGVPRLGLLGRAHGQSEVPLGVAVPAVPVEVVVLSGGVGLDVAPPARHHVLAGVDHLLGLGHPGGIDLVAGHAYSSTVGPAGSSL